MSTTRVDCPLVSVIIPAYNAETRIAETLASVIAQDYPNIEIVVVNDCSTDRTSEIARDILERSGRPFKLIEHATNRGECASRNTAIDAASGELLWCIDADDLARPELVSLLQKAIADNDADIVVCGYKNKFTADDKIYDVPTGLGSRPHIPSEQMLLQKILCKINVSIWAMMFTKKLIDDQGLRFTEGCTAGGDVEFQTKIFALTDKIASIDDCPYIYVHHANMGSVLDVVDREKKLFRYSQLIGVDMRLADHLEKYSSSAKVKHLAKCLLRPEGIIRMFSVAAKRGDITEFKRMRSDKKLMEQLRPAKHMLFTKTEVFFKALMLLYLPSVFYNIRSKRG